MDVEAALLSWVGEHHDSPASILFSTLRAGRRKDISWQVADTDPSSWFLSYSRINAIITSNVTNETILC